MVLARRSLEEAALALAELEQGKGVVKDLNSIEDASSFTVGNLLYKFC